MRNLYLRKNLVENYPSDVWILTNTFYISMADMNTNVYCKMKIERIS